MPGLFHRPISRKRFLQVSAASLGVLCLTAQGRPLQAEEEDACWHLALLSDTHIPADAAEEYRGFRPVENLQAVVPGVVHAAPDAVMLSGDAARLEGKREDYQRLREVLGPVARQAPILIGLGNHDDRKNFFAEFPLSEISGSQNVSGKHVLMLEHPLMRVVMLDSLLYVNKVAGLLGKTQRAWLSETLPRTSDRPMVLFVHHTLNDGDGDLLDTDRLMALIAPFSHVKGIVYGHSHQYRVTERDQVKLINLPACGYNFSDQEPVGWVDARFRADGVALTLRCVGGNRAADGQTQQIAWAR